MPIPWIEVPHAPDGNIYYPEEDFAGYKYYNDFSNLEGVSDPKYIEIIQTTFLHEMLHVWQHQHGVNVPVSWGESDFIFEDEYDYSEVFEGTPFESLELEQQAQFVQDWAKLRDGSWYDWKSGIWRNEIDGRTFSDYNEIFQKIDFDNPEFDPDSFVMQGEPLNGHAYRGRGGNANPDDLPPDSIDNLAEWLQGVLEQFFDAFTMVSPLVLDLGEQGIDLSGTVYWDIDQDGMAEASAWTSGEDGLLAYDRNGDGAIDNHGELFGTETDDGFLMLAEFDTNADGVIDANDAAFNDLVVWIDANTDGYSQAEELYTLDELGITSINLNAAAVNYKIDGNPISSESTFTMNGETRTIVDAWLNYDNVNTVYAGEYTLDVRALFLPTVRGYGNMPDLYIAMSLDNGEGGLLEMVEAIATADVKTLFSAQFDLEGKIREILFNWAGAANDNTMGSGKYKIAA